MRERNGLLGGHYIAALVCPSVFQISLSHESLLKGDNTKFHPSVHPVKGLSLSDMQ